MGLEVWSGVVLGNNGRYLILLGLLPGLLWNSTPDTLGIELGLYHPLQYASIGGENLPSSLAAVIPLTRIYYQFSF